MLYVRSEAEEEKSGRCEYMKLKPRHRWFGHVDKDAYEGWCGPHKTIEAAVDDCFDSYLADSSIPVYIAHGHKMTKDELSGMEDVDFTWEIDTSEFFEIKILKRKTNEPI